MSMNNNSNQQNLCKQGCGFYGNAQNMDMCSKCYQNFLKTSASQEEARSQSSNQISISDIYHQNRSMIVESNVLQLKDSRKRAAQSIESMESVPKARKTDESDLFETGTMEPTPIDDLFSIDNNHVPEPSGIDANKQDAEPDDIEAANSMHCADPICKKPRRCEFCRRKVGLTGFDCRCGGHYCSVHRYSDKHACTFDYQAHGQEQIKHQNPMICGSKIKKI